VSGERRPEPLERNQCPQRRRIEDGTPATHAAQLPHRLVAGRTPREFMGADCDRHRPLGFLPERLNAIRERATAEALVHDGDHQLRAIVSATHLQAQHAVLVRRRNERQPELVDIAVRSAGDHGEDVLRLVGKLQARCLVCFAPRRGDRVEIQLATPSPHGPLLVAAEDPSSRSAPRLEVVTPLEDIAQPAVFQLAQLVFRNRVHRLLPAMHRAVLGEQPSQASSNDGLDLRVRPVDLQLRRRRCLLEPIERRATQLRLRRAIEVGQARDHGNG
jgi:hypothetical protein